MREFRCNDQNVRCLSNQRNRSEVLDGVIRQFAEKVGVYGMCCQSAHDDGLAVRSLFCNVVHADVAAGAGFVFNNDVAQVMTSFFSDGTGCDVQRASGRIRNNNTNRIFSSERRECCAA